MTATLDAKFSDVFKRYSDFTFDNQSDKSNLYFEVYDDGAPDLENYSDDKAQEILDKHDFVGCIIYADGGSKIIDEIWTIRDDEPNKLDMFLQRYFKK